MVLNCAFLSLILLLKLTVTYSAVKINSNISKKVNKREYIDHSSFDVKKK